ncbi:MAG: hypothetical protein IJP44_07075 [Bacteroidales bacterium]|nr:hypothetical protein [Bacteroidales bacterium]
MIRMYYEQVFESLGIKMSDEMLDKAAALTRGFPYLMQLVGYYLTHYAQMKGVVDETIMAKAEKSALGDLEDNVFRPVLAPLSDNDRVFLKAMAQCGDTATIAALQLELGNDGPAIQPYRKRLIDSGVIESPRRGELVFAVPYLSDYLRKE